MAASDKKRLPFFTFSACFLFPMARAFVLQQPQIVNKMIIARTTPLPRRKYGNAFAHHNRNGLKQRTRINSSINDDLYDYPDDDDVGYESESIDDIAASSEFEDHIPILNTVTLTGRIGNDPEAKYLENGSVVVNLSLACKRKYHPMERFARDIKYGDEETDWFNLEVWGKEAEFIANFVSKGARVGITGSLDIDHWMDKNTGEERSRHKIVVRDIDVLETKAEAELRTRNQRRQGGSSPSPSRYGNDDDDYDDYGGGGNNGGAPSGQGGFFD